MRIIAYIYSDPLLESPPDSEVWGSEIDRVYRDLGDRQELKQLINDCQINTPNYLLVRRLDELGDNIAEISDCLNSLEALNIKIVITEQNYNVSQLNNNNIQDIRTNLTLLLKEIQDNQSRRRLKQGHARNRLNALPPPGKAPYGYRRGQDKYIIDKSTAPVVKDFFERFLLFGSLRGAVRYLEKRYGKKISPSTGRGWLINPVYRGDLKYKNKEIISNTHSAIISREEAAQIDRLLRRNSRFPRRTASAPRSLAGLVICQKCQFSNTITRVTRNRKKVEYLYLRCHQCPQQPKCKAIAYEQVLECVITKICAELPQAVAQLNLPNVAEIEELLQKNKLQKQAILAKIPMLIEEGILDQETAALRSYKLRLEISQLDNQIDQLPPGNLPAIAQAVSLPQFWWDLSESERRFYFREFIKQIEIVRTDSSEWDLQLKFIF